MKRLSVSIVRSDAIATLVYRSAFSKAIHDVVTAARTATRLAARRPDR